MAEVKPIVLSVEVSQDDMYNLFKRFKDKEKQTKELYGSETIKVLTALKNAFLNVADAQELKEIVDASITIKEETKPGIEPPAENSAGKVV